MNLSDYFEFRDLTMSRIQDTQIDETVALINPAFKYQEAVKGGPRTNPVHLRKRVEETDFYVVMDKQRIVGCVFIEPKADSLHFGLLTLAGDYRKTGLAQAIMQAIEACAKRHGFKSMGLHYMSLAPWLKQYYESYGFAETGEVVPWDAIDLVEMSKELA